MNEQGDKNDCHRLSSLQTHLVQCVLCAVKDRIQSGSTALTSRSCSCRHTFAPPHLMKVARTIVCIKRSRVREERPGTRGEGTVNTTFSPSHVLIT